ncbi:MAG: hypothetical protein ACRD4B_06005 [Acidobacteriota bacterium]
MEERRDDQEQFHTHEKATERELYSKIDRDARSLAHHVSRLMAVKGGQGRETLKHARRYAGYKARDVDELARENVWTTVSVAAAIGALVSALFFHSKRR